MDAGYVEAAPVVDAAAAKKLIAQIDRIMDGKRGPDS
jgi:hypothetical protein